MYSSLATELRDLVSEHMVLGDISIRNVSTSTGVPVETIEGFMGGDNTVLSLVEAIELADYVDHNLVLE